MDLPTGDVVADRYRVVDRLGRGGMAVVYRAHDEVLDREVALKVLSGHLLGDDRSVDRFGREARAAAGLNHPNVVSVHDAASDRDVHFLVMELVDGEPLSHHLRTHGPLSVDRSLAIADRVAAALGAAHRRDLVHRDVKPSNILLTADGDVKVADFGIARAVASQATQTAVVMGSVPYVAPEQLDGSSGADPRSDLYALGCVLFECLTGGPPFAADTSAAVLGQHLHAPAPSVQDQRPDVDGPVAALVAGLLSKDPDRRPASAEDLRAQIARVRAGEDPDGGAGGAGPAGAAGAGAAGSGADGSGAAGAGAAGAAAAGGAGLWAARDGGDAGPTEVVDPRFAPTEAMGAATSADGGDTDGEGTRRLSSDDDRTSRLDAPPPQTAASGATGGGTGGGGMGLPPGSGSSRSRGRAWLVGLLVLLLLAVVAWAVIDQGRPTDDATTPDATEQPADATEEPAPATEESAQETEQPPAEPTTEQPPAEPTAPAPTTPAEATTPPAPTEVPTPSPGPPTEDGDDEGDGDEDGDGDENGDGDDATEAAIAQVRQDLVDGIGTGQIEERDAKRIDDRLAEVQRHLEGDGDDRLDQARVALDRARDELAEQVESDRTNPGIATQVTQGLDQVEATLA